MLVDPICSEIISFAISIGYGQRRLLKTDLRKAFANMLEVEEREI